MKQLLLTIFLIIAVLQPAEGYQSEQSEKELFARLHEADNLARAGRHEESLRSYLDCLEDSHRLEARAIGPVAISLCVLSETYAPAHEAVVSYLGSRIDMARASRLSPTQMVPIRIMAEFMKREKLLVGAFAEIMKAQDSEQKKRAWGKICFNPMYQLGRFTELREYFDMLEVAKEQLSRIQSKKEERGSAFRGLALRKLLNDFNQYLEVYQKTGDKGRAEKMTALIRQLEGGARDNS